MSAKKTMPMRLDEKVRAAINMIVGEYQAKTGDSFSVSEGLWKYIVEHSPEIAKRAELQVKSTEGQDKPKRTNKPKQP